MVNVTNDADMLEAEVEAFLDSCARNRGGLTRKIVYPGRRGCKDRMLVLPFTGITLCELKRPVGGVYSIHQIEEDKLLSRAGAQIEDFRTKAAISEFFAAYDREWDL